MADLQPTAPLSEEDQFAATVEADRAAKATPETPASAAPVAEAAPIESERPERPRGPDGKFLPADAAPVAAPEPFEGFSKLAPEAQEYFKKLQTDYKREQNRAAAANRELARSRPAPQQRPRTDAKPQPPTPAPQPRKLPKWEAGAQEYPDHFASVEERIKAGEEEAGRKLSDIEKHQAVLDQQLQETRQVLSRFEAREAEERKAYVRKTLDDLSPMWRRTAGWEDAEGNAIPPEKQAFDPSFSAWLEAIESDKPSIGAMYRAMLEHDDPHILGQVFEAFDRDYALATAGEEAASEPGSHATPGNLADRRAEALRDTHARPGTGGPTPGPKPPEQRSRLDDEEAAFVASVQSPAMRQWRGLRA